MLRMQEMALPGFKFQTFSGGQSPRPPIHAWYVGHTHGLQPLPTPSNILSHIKGPFSKTAPHRKILKNVSERSVVSERIFFISKDETDC
jgi:hypothetical protein